MRNLLILAASALSLLSCGQPYDTQAARDKIIADEIEKYKIAKRVNGPGPELCVAAGAVAGEYFYYKDEEHYREWTAIKEKDCAFRMN